jgi:ammonium transporter Rh
MLVLAFMEPMFYYVNFYINYWELQAVDVGGGFYIHMFGCYFGLTVTLFLTSNNSRSHPDNTSCYSSDLFAMIGTLFLWVCWPSFNCAIAQEGAPQLRAYVNTFLSLTASTAATFVFSRLVGEQRFEMVHIQNSTLAGGVAMGIASDMDLYPATAIGVGFITGTISVLGYRFLTPFMNNYLHCQVCARCATQLLPKPSMERARARATEREREREREGHSSADYSSSNHSFTNNLID